MGVLAHSAAAAQRLRAMHCEPAHGDLRDAGALRRYALSADAVIHAGCTGDADEAEIDRTATLALLSGLGSGGKPFVYTSGTWVLGPTAGRAVDEHAPPNPPASIAWRAQLEVEVLRAAGGRPVVLRPGTVFGHPAAIPAQVARGALPIIGDGSQRWPLL